MPLERPAFTILNRARPSVTTKAAHCSPWRNNAPAGTLRASRASQTMILASTRKASPTLRRWSGGVRRSATTLTRCSSTPSADTLVKAAGSTRRTLACSGSPPPHCSNSTGVPGGIAAPSRERTSTTTSRSAGSPISITGVPAATERAFSSKTRSTRPFAGALTWTGSSTVLVPTGAFPANSASSASAWRNALSAAASSLAVEASRNWPVSSSWTEIVLSAWSFSWRRSSLAANRSPAWALSRFATAVSRLASAADRVRASSSVGESGSMTATTVSPAWTSAPALNGMRRSCPATGAETT